MKEIASMEIMQNLNVNVVVLSEWTANQNT